MRAASSARRSISALESRLRMSRPKEMFRRTERLGNIAVSWKTKARLRSLGGTRVMLRPRIQIASSLSGCSSPAMQRNVVVLPQPDGPSITRSSPSSISRLTSLQATTLPPRKVLRRWLTCSPAPFAFMILPRNRTLYSSVPGAREGLGQVLLRQHVENDRRDAREQGHHHQRPPFDPLAPCGRGGE